MMLGRSGVLTRTQECDRILRVAGPDQIERIAQTLDLQFKLMHDRAQLLLGICGVLISTSVVLMTGKLIGRPDFTHHHVIRLLLWAAGLAEILAAGIVVVGVLNVRWMTQIPGDDVQAWVMSSLEYRDQKTRAYRTSILLVILAMTLYQVATLFTFSTGS